MKGIGIGFGTTVFLVFFGFVFLLVYTAVSTIMNLPIILNTGTAIALVVAFVATVVLYKMITKGFP